jgi:Flp pilus assembly pilin Flp
MKMRASWQEDGASAVEYAILASLVAAVVVAAVFLLGQKTSEAYCRTSDSLQTVDANAGTCP